MSLNIYHIIKFNIDTNYSYNRVVKVQLVDVPRYPSVGEFKWNERYYLNGIYLHQNGTLLRTVATDGHRLAQAEMNLPAGAHGMPSIIIHRKTVV